MKTGKVTLGLIELGQVGKQISDIPVLIPNQTGTDRAIHRPENISMRSSQLKSASRDHEHDTTWKLQLIPMEEPTIRKSLKQSESISIIPYQTALFTA
jgi:hypothetical protein